MLALDIGKKTDYKSTLKQAMFDDEWCMKLRQSESMEGQLDRGPSREDGGSVENKLGVKTLKCF